MSGEESFPGTFCYGWFRGSPCPCECRRKRLKEAGDASRKAKFSTGDPADLKGGPGTGKPRSAPRRHAGPGDGRIGIGARILPPEKFAREKAIRRQGGARGRIFLNGKPPGRPVWIPATEVPGRADSAGMKKEAGRAPGTKDGKGAKGRTAAIIRVSDRRQAERQERTKSLHFPFEAGPRII